MRNNEGVLRFFEPELVWTSAGFNNPPDGSWGMRDGTIKKIVDMDDNHILNAIKFLHLKFPVECIGWRVYKNLVREINKRNIDDRPDWDG